MKLVVLFLYFQLYKHKKLMVFANVLLLLYVFKKKNCENIVSFIFVNSSDYNKLVQYKRFPLTILFWADEIADLYLL